jgi:hypothetical protein
MLCALWGVMIVYEWATGAQMLAYREIQVCKCKLDAVRRTESANNLNRIMAVVDREQVNRGGERHGVAANQPVPYAAFYRIRASRVLARKDDFLVIVRRLWRLIQEHLPSLFIFYDLVRTQPQVQIGHDETVKDGKGKLFEGYVLKV